MRRIPSPLYRSESFMSEMPPDDLPSLGTDTLREWRGVTQAN